MVDDDEFNALIGGVNLLSSKMREKSELEI
jgi:hypothetical protein